MKLVQKVWLVDDDEIFVYITKKIIESTEIIDRITVFKNGQNAIDRLREIINNKEDLPEIIFLDLMMPVLDGWGFLEEYNPLYSALDKKITLYILSSSISPQDIRRAREINEVEDFIVKPLTKEIFSAIIKDYRYK